MQTLKARAIEETFTTGEAAKAIGVSKETLYRYLKEFGDINRDDKGNRTWTDDDIERFKVLKSEKVRKKLKK